MASKTNSAKSKLSTDFLFSKSKEDKKSKENELNSLDKKKKYQEK